MIKNELKKKLGLYSLASGAMAVAAGNAEAQITYTDISPDQTVNTPGGTYALDLNGDGTTDFTFDIKNQSNKALYINPAAGNAVLGTIKNGVLRDTALASGGAIAISPTMPTQWLGSSAMMVAVTGSGAYGKFANVTNKYVGLKLKISAGNFVYGWVRVDVSASTSGATSITIKDKAVTTTNNTTLNAGDQGTATGTQQSQQLNNNTTVFVNSQNEVSVINNTESPISAQLMDINGNLIANKELNNGVSVFSSHNLAPGMYVVRMTTEDGIASKKVFIR